MSQSLTQNNSKVHPLERTARNVRIDTLKNKPFHKTYEQIRFILVDEGFDKKPLSNEAIRRAHKRFIKSHKRGGDSK